MPLIRGQLSMEGRLLDWAIAEPTMPRLLPVDLLSKRQAAEELQRVQQRRAADAAYEAELILRMADLTPDAADPPADHPGARSRGWAPDTEYPGSASSSRTSWRWCSTPGGAPPCRSHHRLKTFAPDWQFRMDDDGTLHVTTPSGITRTTRPPGRIEHDLHTAAALAIPDPPPEPWPPRNGSPPPASADDDPPPF